MRTVKCQEHRNMPNDVSQYCKGTAKIEETHNNDVRILNRSYKEVYFHVCVCVFYFQVFLNQNQVFYKHEKMQK